MSILNVGARALTANQTILQTIGNNIANVNTPGYSRQSALLATTPGQYTGSGYIGKGVDVLTIKRTYSQFLTSQAALTGATSASDTARADKLKLLENIFPGGTTGLGAAVNDMLNAFSDVASAPTDLTARTVALTRVSETASRMRSASASLDDLQSAVTQELDQKVSAVNTLATNIAAVNEKIAHATGSGQPPNDLLDQRDQLVRELNRYIQTSSIAASDGSMGIFIGGSQALVLGSVVSPLKIVADDFNDPLKSKLAITRNGQDISMDENLLGGGEVPALLRFKNTDMAEGRNLLGRITLAVSSSMNDQHKLGLDLDGNIGGNILTPTNLNTSRNILSPAAPATLNTGTASLTLGISDVTKFSATDYEINFTGPAAGNITRKSDGVVTAFASMPITVDGLTLSITGSANVGDRFLIKPFSTAANNLSAEFSTPRALAVASPVVGQMGSSNTGSLQLSSLTTRTNPPVNVPITITFTGASTYTRSDDPTPLTPTIFTYTSGQAIGGSFVATSPLSNWTLTMQGAPKVGDTFTVMQQPAAYRNLNAGNASAMMNLRDTAMFDGSALSDGYASLMSQIGIRSQSANYTAEVSNSIAANVETSRTSVSGVNLDEEAANLLQYQQAYQASAKMIQIANSIFDTLIQSLTR
jgi:flagellar hook-associated protein 1 FlgK